jgi:hypothetical protein
VAAGAARAPSGLNRGDAISAASALLLLILMFAFEWYGIDRRPIGEPRHPAPPGAENAWTALTIVRWEMLLTILAAFAAVAIHARRSERVTIATARLVVASLGTLTAALLMIRVLIDLPAPAQVVDQKLGAVLGVLAALGIAFGASDSIREQRERARASHRGARV